MIIPYASETGAMPDQLRDRPGGLETLEAVIAAIGGVDLRIVDPQRRVLYASPGAPEALATGSLPRGHQPGSPSADMGAALDKECIESGLALIKTLEPSVDGGSRRQWHIRTRLPLRDAEQHLQAVMCVSVRLPFPFEVFSMPFAQVVNELRCGRHLYDNCSAIADLAGTTLRDFNRMSMRGFALSARQLLVRARLDIAAQQLITSRESIAGIAHGTGFSDQSAFTRAFGRHFPMTPAMFRRRMRHRGFQGFIRMLLSEVVEP
jgi:AraC-like DNA-binding protein